nr:UvrD-helicase domain-containing protein [Gemmatimonadales bacterium]
MSERRPPTPSQWAAIEAVDDHVLVAAGAGTGKTTTVVQRILYLLGVDFDGRRCAAPLALRDLAAITYT